MFSLALSLALLTVSPVREPLIASHFNYASPGGSASWKVDVAYAPEAERYGLVWERWTVPSKNLVCFSTALTIGNPASPPLVLDTVGENQILTAGPVITDVGFGNDFIVAWAKWLFTDSGSFGVYHVAWLRSDGGAWWVEAEYVSEPTEYVLLSMDIGQSESDSARLAVGTSAGRVFTQRFDLASAGDDGFGGELEWEEGEGSPYDSEPRIARSDRGFLIFHRRKPDFLPQVHLRIITLPRRQNRYSFFGSWARNPLSGWTVAGSGDRVAAAVVERSSEGSVVSARVVELDSSGRPNLGAQHDIAELPPELEVRGLALGETGAAGYALAWNVGRDVAWSVQGVGLKPDGLACEEIFEVAPESYGSWPAMAGRPDHNSALLGWTGYLRRYSGPETQGALVRSCDD